MLTQILQNTGMVGVQSGADKVYEEAILELRKLRAQMQLTFDTCQDDAGRSVRCEAGENTFALLLL